MLDADAAVGVHLVGVHLARREEVLHAGPGRAGHHEVGGMLVRPCSAQVMLPGDLETAKRFGARVAEVTAKFNRNVLAVVNRELDADFDLDAFEHVARWNAEEERIEMWLRATSAQRVHIAALDLAVDFVADEEMLTEVSCKFRPDGVEAELAAAGLHRTHWWTDPAGDFGLSLSTK